MIVDDPIFTSSDDEMVSIYFFVKFSYKFSLQLSVMIILGRFAG